MSRIKLFVCSFCIFMCSAEYSKLILISQSAHGKCLVTCISFVVMIGLKLQSYVFSSLFLRLCVGRVLIT
uniref:Putative ovule protein n=1 Tax=Solanum chacoense TaxID=4108 RepID=A0A0V0GSU0_SOLCH